VTVHAHAHNPLDYDIQPTRRYFA